MDALASRYATLADVIGGASLAGLMIPEAVAYSSIAGLPPAFGVTAAVVGPLSYAIVGRSRLAVVSATSGAAALLAAAIANAALPGVPRASCAIALTGLVGLFFLVGASLRIAGLTNFISRAVLCGFAFGLAITITIGQLPKFLGLSLASAPAWRMLGAIVAHAADIHIPSLLVGGASLLFLTGSRVKLMPSAFIVMVVTTLAMRTGPVAHLGIATVGAVSIRPETPTLPVMAAGEWARLAQLAFPIAIVVLAESWTTIRTLAAARGDTISPEREIAALGLANIASALFRGLPVGAGFSASSANERAGTASRFGAVIAAIVVAAVAFGATDWIAFIPEPVLAAVVISALAHALSPEPLVALFRLGRDQWTATAAAVGVLLFGIIDGLLFAVALSLLELLRRLAYPRISELGRTGLHDFVDCSMHPDAKPVPGMLIVRPDAPLFFGNVDAILADVARRAERTNATAIVLSLEESDDLDSSAVVAIAEFRQAMTARGRSLVLARVHDRARAVLDRARLGGLAATATFSVDDAVQAAINSDNRAAVQSPISA